MKYCVTIYLIRFYSRIRLPTLSPGVCGINRFLNFPESTTEDSCAEAESEDDLMASRTSLERQAPHRGNTTVHVCWHRNTSVSMVDFSVAVEVPEPEPALTCPALASPVSLSLSVCVSISECVSSPGNSVLLSNALSIMALCCYLDIILPQ